MREGWTLLFETVMATAPTPVADAAN